MSDEIVKKGLRQCKGCGRLVPPIKRPSLWPLFIPPVWLPYMIYYWFFKSPECVYCGYLFKEEEEQK